MWALKIQIQGKPIVVKVDTCATPLPYLILPKLHQAFGRDRDVPDKTNLKTLGKIYLILTCHENRHLRYQRSKERSIGLPAIKELH